MKRLLFLLLLSASCTAQVDTIYTKKGRVIACKILRDTPEELKYRVLGQWDQWIDLSEVHHYVNYDEKKVKPSKVTPLTLKPDTATGLTSSPEALAAQVRMDAATIKHMQYYLRRSHEQYNNGLIYVGIGLGFGLGAAVTEGDAQTVLAGMAGGIILVGYINMLASHRWLKKAGTSPNQQVGSSVTR